ncbi:uncharacterized protein LOC124209148 isoform X3 [Daphnia pulex]|uniref:uncharacterized protein LOC124209148 isoform X3 n=1 Tax=Daphnia pulex TaxID=6669 RepID=UPI001EE08DC9|nr:uncharacterized protein LOC124209148 isoform X3 [Daphnia pulex]
MGKMKIYYCLFVYFYFLSRVAGQAAGPTVAQNITTTSTIRPTVSAAAAVNANVSATIASTIASTTQPTATTTGIPTAVPTETTTTTTITTTTEKVTTTTAAATDGTSGVILQSQSTDDDPTENGSIDIPNLIMTFIEDAVNEFDKSINLAANKMNQVNQALNSIIQYRKQLDAISTGLETKVLEDGKLLKDVEDQIDYMDIIEKELDIKEAMLLALNGRETLLSNKIEHDLNLFFDPSVLDSWNISFFAQRNGTFNVKTIIHPYDIVPLNQGQGFSPSSGVFTVPFHGIYHFYFAALKMKQQESGTGRLTIQLVKNRKTVPTLRKVLAEVHLDSADWYGWFPLQLQTTVDLQELDEITAELLEGSLYDSGSPDHLLTDFGGFLITRIYN